MIEFVMYWTPKSLQFGGKRVSTRGGKLRWYKTDTAVEYSQGIIRLAAKHRPKIPLLGAVALTITFVFERPKSVPKEYRGLVRHHNRPDCDNLVKGTQDALSKVGFWLDDGQITDAIVKKRYAEPGGRSRIEVRIEEVEFCCHMEVVKEASRLFRGTDPSDAPPPEGDEALLRLQHAAKKPSSSSLRLQSSLLPDAPFA